ncbi:MAG: alpha/beta hydrolase [Planctomycetota bacterium]|nr:alpha/beta hydrolase [Planctomycetota bacterium]
MLRIAGVGIAVVLAVSSVQAEKPPDVRYEVNAVKDQAYYTGPGADPDKNKLDLYLPKRKQGFPILVFVHGGGYQKGDRKEGQTVGQVLAARGVGVAVISYRLYPQVKHPGQIQDVARAFAWIKANAGRQGGRSSAVFVGGHSAGAHLAALLATDESYLQAETLSLKDIRGVVALSGGYRIQPIRKDVFGSEEIMLQASPFAHVKRGHPPFLIVYGESETPERHSLSKEFRDALKKAGGEAEVLEVQDRTHQELFAKIGDGDPTTEAALSFIVQHSEH